MPSEKPQQSYIVQQFPEAIRSHHMLSVEAGSSPYHMHNSYELYLFLNGNIDFYLDHRKFHLTRGSLLLISSTRLHRYVSLGEQPYERIATHFHPDMIWNLGESFRSLLKYFGDSETSRRPVLQLDEPALNAYLSLTDRLHTALASDACGSEVLSYTYLLQMLVLVNSYFEVSDYHLENTMPELSYQVMQYVNAHINGGLTVSGIADHFYMDRSTLSRRFRAEARCSLQEYIILKRISLAKTLLSEGKNVTEACTLCGFQNYSNFIRTFKKYTGISPGKYKNPKNRPFS